jgi:hypothetical protein
MNYSYNNRCICYDMDIIIYSNSGLGLRYYSTNYNKDHQVTLSGEVF